MEGLKDLKWFLLILIGLWVVWFFTGGPERFESLTGPFLRPPTPWSQSEIYGQDIDLDKDLKINVSLSSGIKSTPISKPCRETPQYTRCNDTRPMKFLITKKKDSKFIKEIIVTKDGNFKIGLQPDKYIIWQKAYYKDITPYQNPIIVKVKSFKYTDVKIIFDNRIR